MPHCEDCKDPLKMEECIIKPEKKTRYKDKNYFEVKEEPKKKMKSKKSN